MEIVYINLPSRPDRNEQFLRRNAGVADFRRTDGVAGTNLQAAHLIRDGVIAEPLTAFTPGALGNALAHKRLWERCAAGDSSMIIAEDDAAFNRRFADEAPQVLGRLPADWDIVLWGWNFDSVLRIGLVGGLRDVVMFFDGRPLGPRVPDFQAHADPVRPLRLVNAFGIFCYSLSPAGARRLLAACFPLTNAPIPIHGVDGLLANISLDATMNRYYRSLSAFACFPPLVWTENDKATSDVAPA